MSGSSSSDGGLGVAHEARCDDLRFEAQLASPKPAVVASLKIGEVLDIAVATLKGQVVVQVLKSGQTAGGLAGPDATRLRNCTESGYKYKATVRALNGGQVRVLVEHRK